MLECTDVLFCHRLKYPAVALSVENDFVYREATFVLYLMTYGLEPVTQVVNHKVEQRRQLNGVDSLPNILLYKDTYKSNIQSQRYIQILSWLFRIASVALSLSFFTLQWWNGRWPPKWDQTFRFQFRGFWIDETKLYVSNPAGLKSN